MLAKIKCFLFPQCCILSCDSKTVTKSSNFILKLCVLHKNQDVVCESEEVPTFVPEFLNLQHLLRKIYRPGASQVVQAIKKRPAIAADIGEEGWIPGSGRSPGEGSGNSLRYFCLENPMDRGAWGLQSPGSHKESDTTQGT